jgi:acyl carrier protein
MAGPVAAMLGRWGMELFVEPSIRELVADHLGVGLEELVAGVTLRDDLAADSLDLVELVVALEAEFGIVVPARILDRCATYGELVEATTVLIRARGEVEVRAAAPPLRMWSRVTPSAGGSGGTLERAGWLTPYAVETIADDAVRAGHGARLEVTVAASTDDVRLARVQHQFAWLGARDVRVTVRRNHPSAAAHVPDSTQTATTA